MSLFHNYGGMLGSHLSLWTGVNLSQDDHVALLMCVAVNGYHSVVSYQWSKNGAEMNGEVYPLLYISAFGRYTCRVSSELKALEHHFETKGMPYVFPLVHMHYY